MVIKKAKIKSVNTKAGVVELTPQGENRDQTRPNVPIVQPYAGRGWGILAGVETDSLVLMDDDNKGGSQILGYVPDNKFFVNSSEASTLPEEYEAQVKFKNLREGELALQSRANSLVFLRQDGGIELSTADGNLLEVNKNTDSINQLSVNQTVITEAGILRNGIVKRDLRSETQKNNDLFLSSFLKLDFSSDENLDFVGVDSSYTLSDQSGKLTGIFDPESGSPSILSIPGLKDIPKANKIVQQIKNPAVTEYRLDINEFSDGLTSANIFQDKTLLKQGRLPLNLASRFVLGTVVDDNGRMPRFDYVFGSGNPKGHGKIWSLPGINETNKSTDFKVDLSQTIESPVALGSTTQWISSGIAKFNTALAMQLVLNTRGADNAGKVPDAANTGSIWSMQVDKEGLTKWNIPASTTLGEKFRKGRSLLWNLDGSITQSVGKESNADLPSITGVGYKNATDDKVKFVNVLATRLDRSWTTDFEGSVEWRIGADTAGQSYMLQADGGHSFYYGKYSHAQPSVVSDTKIGLKSPSKSGKRLGTSISGRTEGAVEFDIGANDPTNLQSAAINLAGMMSITIGQDDVKDSILLTTAGNIRFKVQNGGHKFEMLSASSAGPFNNGILLQHGGLTQSVFQIDANGVITIRNALYNSNIIMSQTGDISLLNTSGKITLSSTGNISIGGATAGIEISPTSGVILRTPGGSVNLNLAGKIELNANSGTTITGPFSHLNTTGVLLGPGAATSAFNVAAMGSGFLDPLTGNPCSVGGFSHIKG